MQESEEKFRNLAEESPNIIFINKGGRIVYVNKKAEDVTGYTREEFYSPNFDFLTLSTPEFVNSIKTFYSMHLRGEAVPSYEYKLVDKYGKRIDAMINTKLIDYGGERAILGIVTDISELKNAEANLSRMMNELVNVNEKLSVVGNLTRHDVRNKLSVVTGNTYLLKKKHCDNPETTKRLVEIEQACSNIVKIFDYAKTYEHIGIEKLIFIDVEKTIEETQTLFSATPDLRIINGCKGLVVEADSLLRQIYYNLIDNSIKHGKKVKNIKIYWEKANQDSLHLIYEDDGVGVPAQNKPQLFKEGFSTGGSTGFGLFLTKKMIEVYGWKIQENGKPGEGAKFTITIPKLNRDGNETYRIMQKPQNRD